MTSKLKTKLAFASVATAVAAGSVVLAKDFQAPDAAPAPDRKQAVNRAEKADSLPFARKPQSVARAEKTHPLEMKAAATAAAEPLMTGSVRSITIDGPDFGDVMDPAPMTATAAKAGPIDGPDFGDVEDPASVPAAIAAVRTGPIDGPDFGDVEDPASVPPASAAALKGPIDGPDFGNVEDVETAPAVTAAKSGKTKPSRKRNAPRRAAVAKPKRGPMVIIPEGAASTPDGPSAIVPSRAPAPAPRSTNIVSDPSGTNAVSKRLWD